MPFGSLSRRGLDNAEGAADAMLHAAMLDPQRHVIAVGGGARLAVDGGRLADVRDADLAEHVLVWLGVDERSEHWVAAIGFDGDEPGFEWSEARELAVTLSSDEAAIAVQALALATWHRDHSFSPVDGSPTRVVHAGWTREDSSGRQHFPRTDPAVIVAVLDRSGDRLLLANNSAWPERRYSLVAGFVDPGESLESAVAREALEEVGLKLTAIEYVSSQPWPYPRSLMVGFSAVAERAEDLEPDGIEIRDARWLTRDDIRNGVVGLPGRGSIARTIIERWLDGDLSAVSQR
ncbi:MAG: NAD(+) diphosphatase [Agrococcus casei]|uniref:NAD(+) diphosphatase n=1 Tax=Agrococcus casei TaxID=343512 RepID=UPI003F96590B